MLKNTIAKMNKLPKVSYFINVAEVGLSLQARQAGGGGGLTIDIVMVLTHFTFFR